MMELTRLNMPCLDTCTNYVEVKYDSMEAAGARFCCNVPTDTIYSQGNKAIVIHKTDSYLPTGWQGWTIRYMYCELFVCLFHCQISNPTTDGSPTTQTTTTVRPSTAQWSAWSSWSSCTSTCGMCGRKQRVRTCGGYGTCA
jgi:hypothetical protein